MGRVNVSPFDGLRRALAAGYRMSRRVPSGYFGVVGKQFGGPVERTPGPFFDMRPLEMWAWRHGRRQRWHCKGGPTC